MSATPCHCAGCRKMLMNNPCFRCGHGRRFHDLQGCHHRDGRLDGGDQMTYRLELPPQACWCDMTTWEVKVGHFGDPRRL